MADDLASFASLFRAREIRLEMQTLRRRIAARKRSHVRSLGDVIRQGMLFTLVHDPDTCPTCRAFDGQISGVNQAIQLFGGRVKDGEQSAVEDQA